MDAPVSAPDTPHAFTAFSAMHLVAVGTCIVLLVVAAWLARGLRGSTHEPRVRWALAGFALAYWIAYNTWWNWNGLDLRTGLPLQACDISGLLAPFALLTQNRTLRATLYFWAFGFATQAFIQPSLTVGPAYILFWAFWIAHMLILGCALYDLVVLGFRPGWGDFGRALLVGAVWAALVVPLDLLLGANYGFLGNPSPDIAMPPAVLALGPWPQRLLVMAALATLGFLLLLAPWLALRRRARLPAA
jgi:hypothetical integral membrane protein (TIGR02206 family)